MPAGGASWSHKTHVQLNVFTQVRPCLRTQQWALGMGGREEGGKGKKRDGGGG